MSFRNPLPHNLKIIRKQLHLSQTAFSEVLQVGFRAYVRYEAGERPLPSNLIVGVARLANVSVDELLTTRLEGLNGLSSNQTSPSKKTKPPKVLKGSMESGRILFKGFASEFQFTTSPDETRLLKNFRSLPKSKKRSFLKYLERQKS